MTSSAGSGKFITVAHAWSAVAAFPRWLTAPTVLAEWTVEPRWHLALKHVRMLLVLAAYSLAWYWLGGQALLPQTRMQVTALSDAQPAQGAPGGEVEIRAISAPTPAPTDGASLTAQDAAGLRIDDFRISAVSGTANRLRYELALSNKGRKLVGTLQFVVLGEQDGDIRELPVTSAAPVGDSKPRIEVARSLKTKGYLDLPEGYIVHKVVVQVVEGGSPRVAQSAPMWPT